MFFRNIKICPKNVQPRQTPKTDEDRCKRVLTMDINDEC